MSDQTKGLPASEVLLDAVAVLRKLADGATGGHRSFEGFVASVDGKPVALITDEGDGMLWAKLGPDEARLLADLLEHLSNSWPSGPPIWLREATALDLAYALTGHQRPEETR